MSDDRMSGRHPGTRGRRRGSPHGVSKGSGYGYRTDTRRNAAVPPVLLDDRLQRRFSELIVPSSVILIGVLAVVAFAFVVNSTMRTRDRSQALPPAAPPALGTLAPIPSDEAAIPIPNASASLELPPTVPPGNASPAPSSTGDRPSERDKPPPPADRAGTVTISRGDVPSRVDLSGEGRTDWVHWGHDNEFSLERRKNGGFLILEGTPTAPRVRHALSPERFSWVRGSPVDHSDGTPTGIRTCGSGNGFSLTAPADTSKRTLRLYVGVAAADGRLDARLSNGGRTVSASFGARSAALKTAVFTITYRANESGTVRLSWVTEQSFDSDCGGVALQAATLS